jgi:uncharacterized protein (DUF1330 family)
MPAYLVGGVDVSDPAWVAEYGPKVEALVEKHGGRYLVRGGEMDVVEGTTPASRVMVVIEFPSLENARAWYNDPEYAPLIKLRQTGSEAEIVLVDGL